MYNDLPKIIVVTKTWEIDVDEILKTWDKEEIETILKTRNPILTGELGEFVNDIISMGYEDSMEVHFE